MKAKDKDAQPVSVNGQLIDFYGKQRWALVGSLRRPCRWRRKIIAIFSLIAGGLLVAASLMPSFGSLPNGRRLERIEASPNYHNGSFENLEPTPLFTEPNAQWSSIIDFFSHSDTEVRPIQPIPGIHTDLKSLRLDQDIIVWLGHSSFYLQLDGKRILIDPMLSDYASPFPFLYRSFPTAVTFTPADIPDIDLLLLSHDHWDHMDYPTLTALRDHVSQVIAPLGNGAHLERWGFEPNKIHELDWNDAITLPPGLTIHAVPARHFSGRGLQSNKSLWAGFMIESPKRRVFYSGDSGYGQHFSQIGKHFAGVDLAIIENGQYDSRWTKIHMQPEETAQAAEDVGARAVLPAHSSRFAMARHSWDAPLRRLKEASKGRSFRLLTPQIGDIVYIGNEQQYFSSWWENIK